MEPISNTTKKWVLDLKNGNGRVYEGEADDSDLTLFIKESDLLQLQEGKLSPQKAFMKKLIKFKGKIMLAMKLKPIFNSTNPKSKL